jgi:hypothetical protein
MRNNLETMAEEPKTGEKPAVKKNHFVSQIYLRGFLNPSQKLWVYDCLRGRVWESDPRSVAYQKNLYSVELPDGTIDRTTPKIARVHDRFSAAFSD